MIEVKNPVLQTASLGNDAMLHPVKGTLKLVMNGVSTKEIYRAVNTLPKEYRIPFIMHLSGFKYREIAEKLGLPLGTVKSRIFFTRQHLQTLLKDFR